MIWARRATSAVKSPASRATTRRATVLCEQPASSPASRYEPVKSKAARISMISSASFKGSLPGSRRVNNAQNTREGHHIGGYPSTPATRGAEHVTATGQFSWPPAVSYLAASGQLVMAADTPARHPRQWRPPPCRACPRALSAPSVVDPGVGPPSEVTLTKPTRVSAFRAVTHPRLWSASVEHHFRSHLIDLPHGEGLGVEPIDRRC